MNLLSNKMDKNKKRLIGISGKFRCLNGYLVETEQGTLKNIQKRKGNKN